MSPSESGPLSEIPVPTKMNYHREGTEQKDDADESIDER
jgi:hypothetical protein